MAKGHETKVTVRINVAGVSIEDLRAFVMACPPWASAVLDSSTLECTWSAKPGEISVPQEI